MATTITGSTSHSLWTFKIVATENSTSIANNTSSVTVQAYIGRSSSASSSYMKGNTISCKVNVTGCSAQTITFAQANGVSTTVSSGGWVSIGSTTFSAVPHNADGKKTVTIGASFTNDVNPSSGSASGSVVLTAIPRASSFGTITGNTIGSSMTVNITRNSTSFTHQLWYKVGNSDWYDLGTGIGTSKTFTIDMALCSQFPNTTSGNCQLCIRTFNGTTQIGSDVYTNVTVYVPSSVKPSCSLSVSDAMGYASTYGGYIKGLSKFKVTVTPTTSYGSSIATYSTTANGSTYTSASFTTAVIKSSGTLTISSTVKDQRGRTGSASTTATVLSYSAPTISKLTVKRCDSDGTENDQGEYVQVTFSGTVTSLNSKNTAAWVLKYKKAAATSYTSVTLSDYANTYSVTNATYVFAADTGSSYNISLTLTDDFGSNTSSTSASTAATIVNWKADGTGIAFGKVSELSGYADFDYEVYARKNLHVRQELHLSEPKIKMGAGIISCIGSGSAGWVFLGSLYSTSDSHSAIIDVFSGDGYNGQARQNTWIRIMIKNGWQSTASTTNAFGITYEIFGYEQNSNIQVTGIAKDYQNVDIYIYLPWTYSNGHYTITGRYNSWTHGDIFSTDAPTGDVCGTIQQINYIRSTGGTMTGTLTLSKTTDLSGTANNSPALIVGGAAASSHLELDCNEIQAKATGTTTDDLYLNNDGGNVYINNSRALTVGNCASLMTNKILWSGAHYMKANQTATLSEAVSAQPHGIVLRFQYYYNSAVNGYNCARFVPKTMCNNNSNEFLLNTGDLAIVGSKRLQIYNTYIVGNSCNKNTGTANGIAYYNDRWVLTQVIGV